MRVAIFSSHKHDQSSFEEANGSFKHELVFFTGTLESATASLASGFPAVCVFVNDRLGTTLVREPPMDSRVAAMAMAGQIRQSLQVIMSARDVLARSLCGKSETVQLALIKGAVMKLVETLDLISNYPERPAMSYLPDLTNKLEADSCAAAPHRN